MAGDLKHCLILSLLFMDHTRFLIGILYIFVPVALLFTRVAKSPVYWTVFGALVLIGFMPLLSTADNHIHLKVYWILAVALCLWTRDQGHTLALNAQLLIGLCFCLRHSLEAAFTGIYGWHVFLFYVFNRWPLFWFSQICLGAFFKASAGE